ncbi:hypothetical protein DACRYDRAFT_59522, partial [Dacryopinax primogenitus]
PITPCLVAAGLWPSTPVHLVLAFTIKLLAFYLQLFADCMAPNEAFCETLQQFHAVRGVFHCNDKGRPIEDPFCHAWAVATQWYQLGMIMITSHLECALHEAWCLLIPDLLSLQVSEYIHQPTSDSTLCPTCFGGEEWGSNMKIFPDILVQLDGNFHHRCNLSGGTGPSFYSPLLFLDDMYVSKVGCEMEAMQMATQPNAVQKATTLVEEVVAACWDSFKAAQEKDSQGVPGFHDEKGLVVCSCMHDVPLLICNITTPGEHQMYVIALIC